MPCPGQFHFPTVLIISITFDLSLTQMLVFLYVYVMLNILLTMLVKVKVAFEDIPVFRVRRPACHDSSMYIFVLVLFIEDVAMFQVYVVLNIFYQHIVKVYWVLSTTITLVFAMFILRLIRLLSSDSSCSICCSSCGVSVLTNMKSAKRRLVRNSPSLFMPLFSQFNLLNMLSSVAVNSLGEMVSPCLTPILTLIFLPIFVQMYCH